MNELLDWAEKAGLENLRFRLQNTETLAREAASTLTVLLAGMGAALAYAVKGLESSTVTPLTAGAAFLAVWLMMAGSLLVSFCIRTANFPAPTNEPLNLYQKSFSVDVLREVELKNIQQRIVQITARNYRTAIWLDRCRFLALCAPLVFAAAAGGWARWG